MRKKVLQIILLRVGISLLDEEFDDFGLKVALDDDFTLFGWTAYAAASFEELGKVFEIVISADEATNECFCRFTQNKNYLR